MGDGVKIIDEQKYEDLLLDELYGELDPETSAAMKRWAVAHPSAAERLASMQATRRAVTMALGPEVFPADLEQRILDATRDAQTVLPFRKRAGAVLSRAGTWAMRPQTAMAAVFLLMMGSSVLLLNGRSSPTANKSAYSVSEEGTPAAAAELAPRAPAGPLDTATADLAHGAETKANDVNDVRARGALGGGEAMEVVEPSGRLEQDVPRRKAAAALAVSPRPQSARDEAVALGGVAAPSAPAPPGRGAPVAAGSPAAASGIGNVGAAGGAAPAAEASDSKRPTDEFGLGMEAYRARDFGTATLRWDALTARTGDLSAELWAARSVRDGRGCAAAAPRFEGLAGRAFATVAGQEATLDAGRCAKTLGDAATARRYFTQLLTVPRWTGVAQRELETLK